MIVQALHAIQHHHGYLPREELLRLADRLSVPLFRIEEVASFFPHYRKQPPPDLEIRVCRDMTCTLRGSRQLYRQLAENANEATGWSVCQVSCLGRCDRAPAAVVARTSVPHESERLSEPHDGYQEYLLAPAGVERLQAAAQAIANHQLPLADSDVTYRPDQHLQWQIDPYRQSSSEPYSAVRRFLACTSEEQREDFRNQAIKALETANLLGMGGAGGRAYKKWTEVRQAVGDEKFVVCNADESEPGTFKDRELLLRAAHLVVEGMILGALVVGAQRGFVYIRHEYHEQVAAVQQEIERARALGVAGSDSPTAFDLEVFVSPGGYICGEQTALIEAIEDKRAEPRNRPPELQTNGLWDKPTLLNNVETLAWVPAILERDAGRWYATAGATPDFKGRRFFSVSGDLNRPGVYEVPIGITLGELIDGYCGGVVAGKSLKAVALSGPSGGFLPAQMHSTDVPPVLKEQIPSGATRYDLRNVRLDLGVIRQLRWMLGGGIVVYADDADMVEQALSCVTFYRNESCGKCVPCRIGCQKLLDVLQALYERRLTADQIEQIKSPTGAIAELTQTMTITAICGLGTVAANPLATLLKYFSEDVGAYIAQS
jgi:NADH:ubiquinone oxidoreductase subunit F (NADH-binding)/NADH:ubiquinone oxidoreductase subunit E